MVKKYELGEEREIDGIKMRRVVALVVIASHGVSPGDVGGWVESESNLSHSGEAWVSGDAQVSGKAWVSGDAQVSGKARVSGEALVYGKARVYGEARVSGKARVYGEALVSGKAWVFGEANVSGEARVLNVSDLLVIGPIGSRYAHLTLAKDYAATGCFCGSWEEFAKQVASTHGSSQHAKEYLAALEFAKVRFK